MILVYRSQPLPNVGAEQRWNPLPCLASVVSGKASRSCFWYSNQTPEHSGWVAFICMEHRSWRAGGGCAGGSWRSRQWLVCAAMYPVCCTWSMCEVLCLAAHLPHCFHEGHLQVLEQRMGLRYWPVSWWADRAAPVWEVPPVPPCSMLLHVCTGIYSSCCWVESLCLLGWAGGSPVAHDSPCKWGPRCVQLMSSKCQCHSGVFCGGLTMFPIPIPATRKKPPQPWECPVPLVLVLPLQPRTPVTHLASSAVAPTQPFLFPLLGRFSTCAGGVVLSKEREFPAGGCPGGFHPGSVSRCSAVPFSCGVLQLSKTGFYQCSRAAELQISLIRVTEQLLQLLFGGSE